jgi:hypothetical protein
LEIITIKLPRIAVATGLANSLVEQHHDTLVKGNVVLIINGHDCEISTRFFVDYFNALIMKYSGIEIIQFQGPPELAGIGSFYNEISGIDFNILVDTIKSNIKTNIDSVGEYVSVTYEIPDIELFAINLLKRGFKLDKGTDL